MFPVDHGSLCSLYYHLNYYHRHSEYLKDVEFLSHLTSHANVLITKRTSETEANLVSDRLTKSFKEEKRGGGFELKGLPGATPNYCWSPKTKAKQTQQLKVLKPRLLCHLVLSAYTLAFRGLQYCPLTSSTCPSFAFCSLALDLQKRCLFRSFRVSLGSSSDLWDRPTDP